MSQEDAKAMVGALLKPLLLACPTAEYAMLECTDG